MNKKVIVSTLAISALAVNVFAQGSNLGPNGTANGDASLIIGTNNTTTTSATLGAENQYTLNVAFKTGKGSDYIAEAKDAQSRISKLERLVDELTQEVAAQRRI